MPSSSAVLPLKSRARPCFSRKRSMACMSSLGIPSSSVPLTCTIQQHVMTARDYWSGRNRIIGANQKIFPFARQNPQEQLVKQAGDVCLVAWPSRACPHSNTWNAIQAHSNLLWKRIDIKRALVIISRRLRGVIITHDPNGVMVVRG